MPSPKHIRLIPPHSVLSRPVSPDQLAYVKDIAEQMVTLMDLIWRVHGKGSYALAHPQVEAKEPLAFFVTHPGSVEEFWNMPNVIINPVLTRLGSLRPLKEGCLTFPGRIAVPVLRSYKVSVTFRDLDWKEHSLTLSGRAAQVFAHEYDHLIGKYIYPHEVV